MANITTTNPKTALTTFPLTEFESISDLPEDKHAKLEGIDAGDRNITSEEVLMPSETKR
jgi:hypothetical protein